MLFVTTDVLASGALFNVGATVPVANMLEDGAGNLMGDAGGNLVAVP